MSKALILVCAPLVLGIAHAQDEQLESELTRIDSIHTELHNNVARHFYERIRTSAIMRACDKPGISESLYPSVDELTSYIVKETDKMELTPDQARALVRPTFRTVQTYSLGIESGARTVLNGLSADIKEEVCKQSLEIADKMLAEG